MEKPALSVTNLRKSFGRIEAVRGISFEVRKGEIFALIGPNGAGKSTTLKMLSTLIKPTSGDALILSHSITKDPEQVRTVLSYLPEEAGAYKNMRGRDYLAFMAALSTADHEREKRIFQRGCTLSGLGKRLDDKVTTYSKGMTRKLLLARTVMTEPSLAILDEPTSGLDISNAMSIRKTIRQLAKEGMTVILSSHNMLEIEFLSDRIGLISGGVLHDIGTADELKKTYGTNNLEEVFLAATGIKA